MQTITYKFVGYTEYEEKIVDKLISKIRENIGENPYFEIAVNEAVVNAAKYSIFGIDEAEITIIVRITLTDVAVIIKSITRPFSADHYRQQLYQLMVDDEIKELPWGDYTADTEKSRGFWYMLTACEYLIIKDDGNEVTLCIRRDSPSNELDTKIKQLVPKFLIQKDGVIS